MLLYISDEKFRMTQWPDFIVEGDMLYISCAVSYSGQLAPSITWSPPPDNILPLTDTGSFVASTVQVLVPAAPGSVQQFTCSVTFDGLIFPLLDNRTSIPTTLSGKFSLVAFEVYRLAQTII